MTQRPRDEVCQLKSCQWTNNLEDNLKHCRYSINRPYYHFRLVAYSAFYEMLSLLQCT